MNQTHPALTHLCILGFWLIVGLHTSYFSILLVFLYILHFLHFLSMNFWSFNPWCWFLGLFSPWCTECPNLNLNIDWFIHNWSSYCPRTWLNMGTMLMPQWKIVFQIPRQRILGHLIPFLFPIKKGFLLSSFH